jgi:hypothetical protein
VNRLDEALARLQRAVARLEAAFIGSGGGQPTSRPVGPSADVATIRLERGARDGVVAGTIAEEGIEAEGRGVE